MYINGPTGGKWGSSRLMGFLGLLKKLILIIMGIKKRKKKETEVKRMVCIAAGDRREILFCRKDKSNDQNYY